MADCITDWLLKTGSITEENREIVRYGLTEGMASLMGIMITVLAGCALGVFVQSCLYITALIPLRIYAGGYHADSRARCAAVSFLLMIGALGWMRCWTLSSGTTWLLMMVEAGLLFLMIPVSGNEVLDDLERIVYKRRGRRILFAELLVFTGMRMFRYEQGIQIAAVVFSTVLVLVVSGKIKDRMRAGFR